MAQATRLLELVIDSLRAEPNATSSPPLTRLPPGLTDTSSSKGGEERRLMKHGRMAGRLLLRLAVNPGGKPSRHAELLDHVRADRIHVAGAGTGSVIRSGGWRRA